MATPTPADIEERLFPQFGSTCRAGETIFREGDPGQTVYVVVEGQVRIEKAVGARSKVLAELGPGDVFGEMALITERPRSATATAVVDARLLSFSGDAFYRLLRHSYDFTVRIIEQLSARLAEADKRLEVLLFTDATARLIRLLEAQPDGRELDIAQLSFDLGVPPDRLAHIARKLQEKGVLSLEGDTMKMGDPDRLAKLKSYLFLRDEFGQIE